MKPVKSAILTFLLTSGVLMADSINWFNTANIVDSSGSDVLNTSQWYIQMYVSVDTTINFSNGAPTGDDTILASVFTPLNNLGAGTDGFFFTNFDPTTTGGPADNANVYSVIFNATTITGATQYAVIDNVTTNVHDSTIPANTWDYDTGGTIAGNWQPIVVPEPTSLALMGLGICAAGLRKKFRANA